ncbi:MAG TPA: MBOAT family O-acyltransferase, partial [Nitrososphaera sp.]|nr:MBOAT family O-acyltransferase [Nitrososphaera sp.]
LFGYKVPINFNLPYIASNISDFWRRWHISLSTWLRDYLFIPLGGSRGNKWMTYRNLFITMALGGLWHGAAMHFLLWGVYQGVMLILHREYEHLVERLGVSKQFIQGKLYHAVSVVFTFHIVCIGWVFFRADSESIAFKMLQKMACAPVELFNFSLSQLEVLRIRDPIIFPSLLLLLPALMVSHLVVNWLNDKKIYQKPPWAVQVGVMVALMCILTIFSPDSSPRFIYFQF